MAELPEDRVEAVSAIRQAFLDNLPEGYEEGMQYGGIGYYVPHSRYPSGYHCDPKQPLPFAGIASQKNHIGIYLFCLYTDQARIDQFVTDWKSQVKKLDMGKSCIRVKKLADVPLDVLGGLIKSIPVDEFIAHYEGAFKR
jgi:hypothetical protein